MRVFQRNPDAQNASDEYIKYNNQLAHLLNIENLNQNSRDINLTHLWPVN